MSDQRGSDERATTYGAEIDLGYHGDRAVTDGLVDLAVNVRGPAPQWLRDRLIAGLDDLDRYPDPRFAQQALAARHGVHPDQVVITAGAAEAFTLLARELTPRHAVVVHPQFTEPEAALRAAGHPVERLLLPPPFVLDPALVPADVDLIMIGNPTNPTSVLHPKDVLRSLSGPGRVVVVDEAFADCVPGEPESLATEAGPGLVVVRSLTKTWGLAGLRVGFLIADPALAERLAARQPLWPVSSLALMACQAVCEQPAVRDVTRWAAELTADRDRLIAGLSRLPGVDVVPGATASFVLFRHAFGLDLPTLLADRGFAVRRCDTFPGLGPDWLRVAVRTAEISDAFCGTLSELPLAEPQTAGAR